MFSKRNRWLTKPKILVSAILLAIGIGYYIGSNRAPVVQTFFGPIQDGNNAFGMHGMYGRTIDFSLDAKSLAYIWSQSTYIRTPESDGRPLTLTETLEMRVRSTTSDDHELKIPLDSVDFRPNGLIYYTLDASLQMSPDSRYVAAVCSRRLVLVDINAKTNNRMEYAGEWFGTFAWLDRETLCFSTYGGKRTLTFWQYKLGTLADSRVKVYEASAQSAGVEASPAQPPGLEHDQWSPNGRFVCIRIPAGTNEQTDAILDVQTGTVQRFPFSLYYQSWKPDSSALLVDDKLGTNHQTFLVDPLTGKTDDLSSDFEKKFGRDRDITLVAPIWTLDGKYVALYANSAKSTAIQQGYLIQPKPFIVGLSTNQIIRWAPVPGWVLLQGQSSFNWINYTGNTTAPIQGWPNDWIWSSNGNYAARIYEGEIEILKPQLPPGVKNR